MRVEPLETDTVHGHLHRPDGRPRGALALTHGAGGNCDTAILQAVCARFAEEGFLALRYNLPFRRRRPKGPPQPSRAKEDRDGIAAATDVLREQCDGPLLVGGVSYGGRQTSMLVAERPDLADALLLLSYPLHPPGKPDRLRTEHLPDLTVPCVFVHGDRDPFGRPGELREAVALVPAPTTVVVIEGAAHDLGRAKGDPAGAALQAVLRRLEGVED